jgi:hypothetical protein
MRLKRLIKSFKNFGLLWQVLRGFNGDNGFGSSAPVGCSQYCVPCREEPGTTKTTSSLVLDFVIFHQYNTSSKGDSEKHITLCACALSLSHYEKTTTCKFAS